MRIGLIPRTDHEKRPHTKVVLAVAVSVLAGILLVVVVKAIPVLLGNGGLGRWAFWGMLLWLSHQALQYRGVTVRVVWSSIPQQLRADWPFLVGILAYQAGLLLIVVSVDQRVVLEASAATGLVHLLSRKIPAAVVEEIFFRVALCEALDNLTPRYLVPLTTSIAFAMAHVSNISRSQSDLVFWTNVANVVFALLFGYLAASRYIRSRNAGYVILLHCWVAVQELVLKQIGKVLLVILSAG